jgi:hypothetical protein
MAGELERDARIRVPQTERYTVRGGRAAALLRDRPAAGP